MTWAPDWAASLCYLEGGGRCPPRRARQSSLAGTPEAKGEANLMEDNRIDD